MVDRRNPGVRGSGLAPASGLQSRLPLALVRRAARQAGRQPIPGIRFRRLKWHMSRHTAWVARVELARTVPQLALCLRELQSWLLYDAVERPRSASDSPFAQARLLDCRELGGGGLEYLVQASVGVGGWVDRDLASRPGRAAGGSVARTACDGGWQKRLTATAPPPPPCKQPRPPAEQEDDLARRVREAADAADPALQAALAASRAEAAGAGAGAAAAGGTEPSQPPQPPQPPQAPPAQQLDVEMEDVPGPEARPAAPVEGTLAGQGSDDPAAVARRWQGRRAGEPRARRRQRLPLMPPSPCSHNAALYPGPCQGHRRHLCAPAGPTAGAGAGVGPSI